MTKGKKAPVQQQTTGASSASDPWTKCHSRGKCEWNRILVTQGAKCSKCYTKITLRKAPSVQGGGQGGGGGANLRGAVGPVPDAVAKLEAALK
eukprot:184209-Pyramimonas_sp.AAC.1